MGWESIAAIAASASLTQPVAACVAAVALTNARILQTNATTGALSQLPCAILLRHLRWGEKEGWIGGTATSGALHSR